MNEKPARVARYYNEILNETLEAGFTMASDILTCSLLRTLASSKPGGRFLELGTGTGLSTAWIIDGMDTDSTLTSVDNDPVVLGIARKYLSADPRVDLVLCDGEEWIDTNSQQRYDYIFADTWHGKYLMLDKALAMVKPGGLYIIDDMLPQPNWPEGHDKKATALLTSLKERDDFTVTAQAWATGIVIATKRC